MFSDDSSWTVGDSSLSSGSVLKWKAGIEAVTEVEERLYARFEKMEKEEGLKFERAT